MRDHEESSLHSSSSEKSSSSALHAQVKGSRIGPKGPSDSQSDLQMSKHLFLTNARRFSIAKCPKLVEHLRAFVRNKCFECGFLAPTDAGLKSHIQDIHKRLKVCKRCGFSRASDEGVHRPAGGVRRQK